MNLLITADERKQEVLSLLKELSLPYEILEVNKIKIFGKSDIYFEFFETGHVHVYKFSRHLKRNVRDHKLASMKAINSYLKEHAI